MIDPSDLPALGDRLVQGDRRALARAITLVESTRPDHRAMAADLLARVAPAGLVSTRIGISGTPGVGKSTFIEAFGRHLTGRGHKVAVLAVDPSSARGGGSILGDKTRMTELSRDPNAFIRPSPSSGTLGGVARRTREAVSLVEAAGFDMVLVETVGVGQSETTVADMVDLFLLLLAPGGGDDLQGIKRGIMELADIVVVNKADGDLLRPAKLAQADYQAALSLMRPRSPAWRPPVLLASAMTGDGIAGIRETIAAYRAALEPTGELAARRAAQGLAWLDRELADGLVEAARRHPEVAAGWPAVQQAVRDGRLTPAAGAARLIAAFLGRPAESA
ncbi:MAG: methylmalonyl Co-A mutase-associated GTPase MeaB [Alphaproteobacteria bacterium]|jgi:LAO/AO transport system kinase|nr:methylmalonyl Co-A mutase-associated GTPase MeaB [Alphaproteobacteria bacterium]